MMPGSGGSREGKAWFVVTGQKKMRKEIVLSLRINVHQSVCTHDDD